MRPPLCGGLSVWTAALHQLTGDWFESIDGPRNGAVSDSFVRIRLLYGFIRLTGTSAIRCGRQRRRGDSTCARRFRGQTLARARTLGQPAFGQCFAGAVGQLEPDVVIHRLGSFSLFKKKRAQLESWSFRLKESDDLTCGLVLLAVCLLSLVHTADIAFPGLMCRPQAQAVIFVISFKERLALAFRQSWAPTLPCGLDDPGRL